MPNPNQDGLLAAIGAASNTPSNTGEVTIPIKTENKIQENSVPQPPPQIPKEVQPPVQPLQPQPQDQPPKQPDNTEKAAEQVVDSAGLDMESLSSSWHENGELPEDAYGKFEEMGLSREVIDQVCNNVVTAEGQKVAAFKSDVASSVGGDENLSTLVAFVQSPTFDSQKRDELMSMVTLDNPTQSKLALQEVQKMYEAQHGASGNLITGQKSGGGAEGVYASRKEQSEAIVAADRSNDPAQIKAAHDKSIRTSQYNRKNNRSF